MAAPSPRDPRLIAGIEMLRRTGAAEVQIRYSDDEQPVVWMAVAGWDVEGGRNYEAAAALTPHLAVVRLCEKTMDGGTCTHCDRPTSVSGDFDGTFPMSDVICWYVYDPELQTFRRGCEGDT